MLTGDQKLTISPACEHKNGSASFETIAKNANNNETKIKFSCPDCGRVATIYTSAGPATEGHILWSWDSPGERQMKRAANKSNAAAKPPAETKGPGTEMLRLTAELGIVSPPGCGCKGTAGTMDRLGVAGCRERITDLRLSVAAGWAAWGWKDKLTAVAASAWKAAGLGVNPTDPVRDLLEIAIERAESKAKENQ